jgi:hypothetical protein
LASRPGGGNGRTPMLTIENLVLILIVLVVLPWVSYTTAKLGTIGYLRGREFFNKRKGD